VNRTAPEVDDIPAPEPCNEEWALKRELAAALKELNELAVSSRPDAGELRAATQTLREMADRWRSSPRLTGRHQYLEDGSLGDYVQLTHEIAAMHGQSNPISPPVHTRVDHAAGLCFGHVTAGWQYEGPPGSLHGGIVGAILDHFLGVTQSLTGLGGVTGTLKIRYHARTPLNARLTLKGWIERQEGRKIIGRAEMYFENTLTAEAEGLFIVPREGSLAHLKAPVGAGSAQR
jgi:hypothetical protein